VLEVYETSFHRYALMGVGRIFYRGGQEGIFPKFFPGGSKVVKFVFYPSKLKKQPFLAINFKIQGGQGPLLPPFRRPCMRFNSDRQYLKLFAKSNTAIIGINCNITIVTFISFKSLFCFKAFVRF